MLSSAAVAVAIAVALVLGGGSLALWGDSAAVNAGIVTSGSMELRVNSATTAALGGAVWSSLLPGDVVSQQVTVQNIGTVVTTVTALTTGSVGALLVHVKKGACSTTITGTSTTVSPATLGTFADGESAAVCIQVSLPTTTPNTAQGTAQSFTVTLTGTTGT